MSFVPISRDTTNDRDFGNKTKSKTNKKRKKMARNIRGEYRIRPYKAPATRQQLWRLTGMTLLGHRVREQGFETRDAAQARKDVLVKEDADTEQTAPRVFTSHTITSPGMLGAVETSVALLKEAGYPLTVPARTAGASDDYVILLSVRYSLANGFNPLLVSKTLADLDVLFRADLQRRRELPRTDEDRIKMRTAENYEKTQNRLMRLFPNDLQLTALAKSDTQKRLIKAARLSNHVARTLRVNIGLMLQVAKEAGWILSFDCWDPPKHIPQQPKFMSIPMCQLWLNGFWPTNRAAWSIILLFGGLRPSEFHAEGSHLSEDLSIFAIPEEGDTKTGWRDIHLPPVAQILLRQLQLEGRLVLEVSHDEAAEREARGKIGFQLSPGRKREWARAALRVKYREVSTEDAIRLFDQIYPPSDELGRWVADYARHTCASHHATSCQDAGKTAQYLGNSKKVVKRSYWGRIKCFDECERFYRLVPEQLRGMIDPNAIKLPNWFSIHTADERKTEVANVSEIALKAHGKLVASGRNTSSTIKNKQIEHMRRLAKDRSPEQIRDSLAKARAAHLSNQAIKADERATKLRAKLVSVEEGIRNPQPEAAALVMANGNPRFRGNENKSGVGIPTVAFANLGLTPAVGNSSEETKNGVVGPEMQVAGPNGKPETKKQALELGTQAPAPEAPAMPVPDNAQFPA
ncbi:MAG TPA: hypothetical protein VFE51_21130 [Verrucomicrobiae bacterium]|nr:hypothetical protein [Verrucomicrobiae bacterium]